MTVMLVVSPIRPRTRCKDANGFLLEQQYVQSHFIDEVYMMFEGRGQGRILSPAFASSSFLHCREFNCPRLAIAAFKPRYLIIDYHRYADNLPFVCQSSDYDDEVLEVVQHQLYQYKCKIEEVSGDGISILDVHFYQAPISMAQTGC